jgi:hypothetical protein
VTHSPYTRAPDLSVTLSRIAVQYLTLIFHQHTEAKDVITSKRETGQRKMAFSVLGMQTHKSEGVTCERGTSVRQYVAHYLRNVGYFD